MALKRKKESKWLIVENRKVHCYLCGRKMMKVSQRIYDAESGHYSHAICEKEKQLTGTNERRSAVKKIVAGAGVLGLTAVGVDKFTSFGRMSNSVFSSNAKDQTANPELETVITSQGIILPSLKSDPANPVAGQMWYRSDAGVTAHFDSIQNRVVYSSEINDGNVNVTSKGIINGLSVLPNDGTGGFGPDTTSGATSVGEIGSPYTQTVGIQETVNFVFNKGGGKIKLTSGMFAMDMDYVNTISQTVNAHVIEVPQNSTNNPIITIEIDGVIGENSDYQTGYNATPSITPTTPDNGSIIYLPELVTSNPVGGAAIFGSAIPPTENADAGLNNNVNIILKNVTIMNQLPSSSGYQLSAWQLDNFAGFDIDNVVATVYTSTGALANPLTVVTSTDVSGQNGISINPPHNGNGMARIRSAYIVNYQYGAVFSFNVNEVQHLHVDYLFVQYCTSGITFGNVGNYPPVIDIMDLEQNQYPITFNNSTPIQFYRGRVQIQNQGAYSSTDWSNAEYDIYFNNSANVYGNIELYVTGGSITDNPIVGGNTQYNQLNITQITGQGSIALFPKNVPTPTLTANPPVSGTVYQNTNPYDIEIDLPVYATTSGTAGYVTVAKGSTDTPTAIGNQYVSGDTSSTATQIIRVRVPAGWYYSFTGSGVTFGTATPFAE